MTTHFLVSLIKSIFRIICCIIGAVAFRHVNPNGATAFLGLAVAEVIGIIEEIGE